MRDRIAEFWRARGCLGGIWSHRTSMISFFHTQRCDGHTLSICIMELYMLVMQQPARTARSIAAGQGVVGALGPRSQLPDGETD